MKAQKRVFIETSVFIRFLTKDNDKKYQSCYRLFQLIQEGRLRPYTSNMVIAEIIFILTRHYNFPKSKVLKAIKKLLLLRNLTIIEKTATNKALNLFSKRKIKYGDALIATQVPQEVLLLTYDKDFEKISGVNTTSPEKIVRIFEEIAQLDKEK